MSATLRALLIDDERLARRELAKMLGEHEDVAVVGEAASIDEAAALVTKTKPSLVFLDVQLAGETGFELFSRVEASFNVIFVTAFDQHALRAFEVNALDYLLKPVHPDRLSRALDRVRKKISEPAAGLRNLQHDDRLFLEDGRKSRFVRVADIVCLRAADDYSEVVLASGEIFLIATTLKDWEERLPGRYFTRIHRSAIVNLDFVDRVEPWLNDCYQVFVRDLKEPLAMSRRHAARLKERFG